MHLIMGDYVIFIGAIVSKDLLSGVKLYGSSFSYHIKEKTSTLVYGNWVCSRHIWL